MYMYILPPPPHYGLSEKWRKSEERKWVEIFLVGIFPGGILLKPYTIQLDSICLSLFICLSNYGTILLGFVSRSYCWCNVKLRFDNLVTIIISRYSAIVFINFGHVSLMCIFLAVCLVSFVHGSKAYSIFC